MVYAFLFIALIFAMGTNCYDENKLNNYTFDDYEIEDDESPVWTDCEDESDNLYI